MQSGGRGRGEDGTGQESNIPGSEDLIGSEGRSAGPIASAIPTSVAVRLLTCSLECPTQIVVGRPSRFRFHVKNRSPTGVALTMPTSRSWGWMVDDAPEAGTGRFDPPSVESTLVFGPRECRTFVGTWDGQIRGRDRGRDIWTPTPGEHELVAYLALENWEHIGTSARETVRVVQPDNE